MLAWRARERFERGDWLAADDDVNAIASASPITRLTTATVFVHLRARRGDPDVATPLTEARELSRFAAEVQRTAKLVSAVAEIARLEDRLETVVDELRTADELALGQRNDWIVGEFGAGLWRVGAIQCLP